MMIMEDRIIGEIVHVQGAAGACRPTSNKVVFITFAVGGLVKLEQDLCEAIGPLKEHHGSVWFIIHAQAHSVSGRFGMKKFHVFDQGVNSTGLPKVHSHDLHI